MKVLIRSVSKDGSLSILPQAVRAIGTFKLGRGVTINFLLPFSSNTLVKLSFKVVQSADLKGSASIALSVASWADIDASLIWAIAGFWRSQL